MQIRINQSDSTPYYEQVVNQVKYLIATGQLQPEESLPSVRGLAEHLLINPNTVARAYRELESEGLVTTRRGAGVFVAESGSRLSAREKNRILNSRIDALLTESRQLNVDLDALLKLIHQRNRRFES